MPDLYKQKLVAWTVSTFLFWIEVTTWLVSLGLGWLDPTNYYSLYIYVQRLLQNAPNTRQERLWPRIGFCQILLWDYFVVIVVYVFAELPALNDGSGKSTVERRMYGAVC